MHTKTGNTFQKRIIQLLKDQHEDFSYLPSLYRIVLSFRASMEKEMATHSSILAWRIPWTEEPGMLQSMGSQRVGHDRATNTFTFQVFYAYQHPCCCCLVTELCPTLCNRMDCRTPGFPVLHNIPEFTQIHVH